MEQLVTDLAAFRMRDPGRERRLLDIVERIRNTALAHEMPEVEAR